ncbi:uncharacterized protein [Amphiura filiformis]|uniref:uncharacterized protein n=1 Tax=Amphiura filiformis TaxID=82378 RepID=UPI003B21E20B
MTLELCFNHCGSFGYAYAGLQASSYCFCGDANDDYARYGAAIEDECSLLCLGNNQQKCGGALRNSVYGLRFTTNMTNVQLQSFDFSQEYNNVAYQDVSITNTYRKARPYRLLNQPGRSTVSMSFPVPIADNVKRIVLDLNHCSTSGGGIVNVVVNGTIVIPNYLAPRYDFVTERLYLAVDNFIPESNTLTIQLTNKGGYYWLSDADIYAERQVDDKGSISSITDESTSKKTAIGPTTTKDYDLQTTARTNAADASTLTSPIIIGVTTAGVGILVIILVIGFVIYCKRRKNPELQEPPEYEPYATYRPPIDDLPQRPVVDMSGPELPGHLPVAYSTYVTDDSSQHLPIDTSGPELPGHFAVGYFTYVPPDNSSAHHPHVDASDYEIPLENMGNENVGDGVTVPTDQGGYIEVIA